jgi:hypothetical protein
MRKEYMRIPLTSIPQTIIDQYELLAKAHKGFVLVEISKGMYGLPQAGILAFNQLKTHLATTVTLHAPTHLAYGPTPHDPSPSHSSSTISGSNTPTATMPSTCSHPSKNSTPSQPNGPALYTSR